MTNAPVLRIRTDLPGNRPRVLDTDLAVLLGYLRPKDIRFLIRGDKTAGRKYVETQERFLPGMRGTPGKDYWLTFEEAERFIRRSRCSNPDHARDVIVRAFQPHLLILADKTAALRLPEQKQAESKARALVSDELAARLSNMFPTTEALSNFLEHALSAMLDLHAARQ
jgi:hypothetical protein